MLWLAWILLWKYSMIFTTFFGFVCTSSSILCIYFTRSELTCSDITFSIDVAASCTFWCTWWMIHITISSFAYNSSTLSSCCCCCVSSTIIYCCNFLISVALAIFCTKGCCFILFFICVIFSSKQSAHLQSSMIYHHPLGISNSERLGRKP